MAKSNENTQELIAQYHQIIQRPHSTTPFSKQNKQQHQQFYQQSRSSPQLIPNPIISRNSFLITPLLPRLITPVTSQPSSSRSSPFNPHHLTPPSPLLSPLRSTLTKNNLTRANSLPGQIPRSNFNTSRPSPHSRPRLPKPTLLDYNQRYGSSPPPLNRLPTSPTPASAVIGQSGLTVVGRMVEYDSDHTRSEALSRALRAVSQSGIGRSRHRSRYRSPIINNRSLSFTASSSNTSPGGENYNPSCSPSPISREERFGGILRPRPLGRANTSVPTTPADPDTLNHVTELVNGMLQGEESNRTEFPFAYQARCDERCSESRDLNQQDIEAPNSQASGYISFSSLNLFAPPSPPHSLVDFDPHLDE